MLKKHRKITRTRNFGLWDALCLWNVCGSRLLATGVSLHCMGPETRDHMTTHTHTLPTVRSAVLLGDDDASVSPGVAAMPD